ncbi:zinc finger CCCH domain-containing protein 11A-like [Bacillus rossius redtenbacheri]|uniref:zinc finger CCCH domain-containing protein 11A-like n=1 Tax=Bacillus rossius redtenbacheri TaxID=93214 RepID=UPI002FDD4682
MDTPRKNNDCYFYYYSTCRKGDGCSFRHEPSALGCETTCSYWQQGKCLNQRCSYRHMELRKNRKLIPCYWENQPGGCRKPHCSFLHKTSRDPAAALTRDEPAPLPSERAPYDESAANSDVAPRRVSSDTNFGNPPIDPLVVNFEEESDSESAPTTTPVKTPAAARRLVVKTLDEIRLERVQAEQAALLSYAVEEEVKEGAGAPDLRAWLRGHARRARAPPEEPGDAAVVVKTLEQIRAERAARKRSHSRSPDETSPRRRPRRIKLQRDPERWTGPPAAGVNGNCAVANGSGAGKLRDSLETEEELLSDGHADVVNIGADEDILRDIDDLLMD